MNFKVFFAATSLLLVLTQGAQNSGIFPILNHLHLPSIRKPINETTTVATVSDSETPIDDAEIEFTPGMMVNHDEHSSPLTKIRDTILHTLIPALTRPFSRQSQPSAIKYVTDCTDYSGVQCMDCNTIILCEREMKPLTTVKCPSATPYCVSSSCSATTPDQTCSRGSSFLCSTEGYFPDPFNCSLYYYCPGSSQLAQSFECPSRYNYNSFTRNCQHMLLMHPWCKPMDCARAVNDFVVYPQNNGYFGYCSNNGTSITMFKCPDADNQVYIPERLGCEYKCKKPGFFADTLDCQSYYFCYYDGLLGLKHIHYTCPASYQYENGRCVRSANQCENVVKR